MQDSQIIRTEYSDVMKKSYIDYAMSVIVSRALPDVRDGLKPVQRRTLYDMYELGIRYDKPYRKCARIVGDTMGKYHPHGDSSIYEALVVMAQDFKKGLPLVDGHGNFGSIDGDGADIVNTIFFRHGIIAIVIVDSKTGAVAIRNFSKRGILDFFLKSFNQDGFCFRRQEEANEIKDIIAEVLTDCHGSAAEHGHQGKNSREQNNRPFPAPSMHGCLTGAQLLGLQYVLPPYAAQNVQQFQIGHAKPSSCSCA